MDCKKAQSMINLYITQQLQDSELELFIDHIDQCAECREELEIYYSVHFALQKLDEDSDISYNIKQMMEDNLEASKRRISRQHVARICCYSIMLAAELFLAASIFTQVELWGKSDIKKTSVYQMFSGEDNHTLPNASMSENKKQIKNGEENEEKNNTN